MNVYVAGVGGDADADTDADPGCPLNSGWPCTCNQQECNNGNLCIGVQGLGDGTAGFCTKVCSDDGDCTNAYGQGVCALTSDQVTMYCGILCNSNAECPPRPDLPNRQRWRHLPPVVTLR